MPYIANKSNLAQLTNIHYWDSAGAPAWSGNLLGAATPFAFLPNPVVAGDLVLFGIDSTILNTGPFCSLVFDIGSAITDVTGITWRYSDAGGGILPTAWAAQVVQDNTNQDGAMTGVAFDTSGVESVHWIQDTLWIAQNPTIGGVALGVTGLWICAHVTAAGGAGTPPIQNNQDIYTITWSSVEVAADAVGGDLDALLRLQVQNQSDHDFGNPPFLAADVVTVGLRSVDRGADFVAYLNASFLQQSAFITTAQPLGVQVVDLQTPTGWVARYGGGVILVAPLQDLFTWYIDVSHAAQFYGTFHAYLRAYQYTGAVGDITLALATDTAGYRTFVSAERNLPNTNDWAVVDFGRITLPGPVAPPSEPTRVDISVLGYGNGVANLDIYDLVLIPVDEWAVQVFNPTENIRAGIGGRSLITAAWVGNRYLDIDSISYPKQPTWSVGRLPYYNDYWSAEWTVIGPANSILKAGDAAQRLWVFSSTSSELAPFEIGNSIFGCSYVQRYSSMRGAR